MLLTLRSLYESTAVLVTAAGVAASPAVGVSQIDVTTPISGVVASAAIGSSRIDVTVSASGVAANPQIGTGFVNTGATVTVDLTGVAANPQIGQGTIRIRGRSVGFGQGATRPFRRERIKPIEIELPEIDSYVFNAGVSAHATIDPGTILITIPIEGTDNIGASGVGVIDVALPITPGVLAMPQIGSLQDERRIELTPEELIALLDSI